MIVSATMSNPKVEFLGVSAESLARAYTQEAIGTLLDVMRGDVREVVNDLGEPIEMETATTADKLRAAAILLDRGHGKATQAVITIPVKQRASAKLYAMSDEELLTLAHAARAEMQNANGEGGVTPQKGDPLGASAGAEPMPQAISSKLPAISSKHEDDILEGEFTEQIDLAE